MTTRQINLALEICEQLIDAINDRNWTKQDYLIAKLTKLNKNIKLGIN